MPQINNTGHTATERATQATKKTFSEGPATVKCHTWGATYSIHMGHMD
jgi:hypothetical protein